MMKGWVRGILAAAVLFVLVLIFQQRKGALYVQNGVYYVENFRALEELSALIAQREGDFEGEVRLTSDIQAERPLMPIGNSQSTFNGIFDGGGYVIDGLNIQGEGWFQGMFGYVGTDGCVKNLTLRNICVSGMRYTGGVAGYSAGTIQNCRVEDGWIIGKSQLDYGASTGGIVGLSCGVLTECVNQNTRVEGKRYVGGIVGSQCAGSMERCANSGQVRSRSGGQALVGGIVGGIQTGGKIKACINAGDVYVPHGTWTGGVTGGLLSGGMMGCMSLGEVNGREAGGVAGYVAQRAQVIRCLCVGRLRPGVGEGRQTGVFVLPADKDKVGHAYELLKPLIEQKEYHGDES